MRKALIEDLKSPTAGHDVLIFDSFNKSCTKQITRSALLEVVQGRQSFLKREMNKAISAENHVCFGKTNGQKIRMYEAAPSRAVMVLVVFDDLCYHIESGVGDRTKIKIP